MCGALWVNCTDWRPAGLYRLRNEGTRRDPSGSRGEDLLRELFSDLRGTSLETLLVAHESLLEIVPAGLTVVSPEGHARFVNSYQSTIPGCPWVQDGKVDLRFHEAVPAPLRTGLRRLWSTPAKDAPVQLPPFSFAGQANVLETWLVPIVGTAGIVAAVIVQHDRAAVRVDYGSRRRVPPPDHTAEAEHLGVYAAPALDVSRLRATFALTDRELQIVDALCRGHGTAQIAQDMGISTHTVKDHVKRIQRKMNAPNRLTIVSRALQVSLFET